MRIEKDGIGELEIPKNRYYGIHTQRAIENFYIKNGRKTNPELIKSFALVKLAAAEANFKAGKLDEDKKNSIVRACERVYQGDLESEFPLSAIQGGAGTSTNMNVNEVIANAALEEMGQEKGRYDIMNPIEDVNLSQSTNDVYPTAVKITVIRILRELVTEAMSLQEELQNKEKEFSSIFKLGRTQLQDAVPLTLGQSFGAFAEAISRDRWRLYKIEERIRRVNIGGTAIGTGVGASLKYRYYVTEELKRLTGYGLARAENLIDATQNLDVFVEVSGLLKTMAVNLNKIANDLRLMSSGPSGGIGEIKLPPMQMGSSIMPGKINPVGAEFIKQIFHKVQGNDLIVSAAAAEGEFELNALTPIISESVIESIEVLRDGISIFREKVVKGVAADKEKCEKHLRASLSTITSHIDQLGYELLSEILKECEKTGKSYDTILKEKGLIKE
ncbi:aspartate ammonia-lyase [uncultured Ilyobacter sp.]|uniref:aspartate ammonia-lyase n=1 Tax=uncultured Ilyobacter sp. TaxID=544433 RepID=UPI0029C95A5F|nr:aspartate ammonia-lyase [uncultured Ilyobacter sp.]